MSAETDGAAIPTRGVVQRSKHPREHMGSRCEECICICAVCVHLCARIATGASIFTVTRNTFNERLSPNTPSQVVGRLSCKRLVLKSLRLLLLLQETRWLDGQASQAPTSALREGWETWRADGDGNCFWRSLSLSIWRAQRFYKQVKLVVLAYASEKSEALVNEGHHLHDNITYYDVSVVLKFEGSGTATQHECMLSAELAPLCYDGNLGRADHGVLGV